MVKNQLTTQEKLMFSNHLNEFTEMYNTKLNPFRDYGFKLSEISFGHGNYRVAVDEDIFYFDFPYSEKSKDIVEAINDSQRGEIPEGTTINPNTYKDLDIAIAISFEKSQRKEADTKHQHFVIYKYYSSNDRTPDIFQYTTNLKTGSYKEDELLRYFFLIYHCTIPDPQYSVKSIFNSIPQKNSAEKDGKSFEYLLYFNYTHQVNGIGQVITLAFKGKDERLYDTIRNKKEEINKIYSELIPLLSFMFNNPVLTYYQKEAAARADRIKRFRDINASNHIVKTYLNTKIQPKINHLKTRYPGEPLLDVLLNNVQKLAFGSELTNLLDKINNTEDKDEIRALLLKTKFYGNSKINGKILRSYLNAIFSEKWNIDQTNINVTVHIEPSFDEIPESFLSYGDLSISFEFIELLSLTILENVVKYGKLMDDDSKEVFISYDPPSKTLSVRNETPLTRAEDFEAEFTGNFRTFSNLLERSNSGSLKAEQKAGSNYFILDLKSII